MTELECKVDTCIFNKNYLCSKGEITVGGLHATKTEGTSCDSFKENKSHAYQSSVIHPSKIICVDCEAISCKYNSNYQCHSEKVKVIGQNATRKSATECATFEK